MYLNIYSSVVMRDCNYHIVQFIDGGNIDGRRLENVHMLAMGLEGIEIENLMDH